MLIASGYVADPTSLLLMLGAAAAWLLSILLGVVWLFMSTPDGWKRTVRRCLVAANLLGIATMVVFGVNADPTVIALAAVSLAVAVLLLVLRNEPAPGAPGGR